MVIIRKDNFVIRSAQIKDAEQLTSWWNNGEVMAHAGFPLGLGQSLEKTSLQILSNNHQLSQRCIIEINDISIGEMSYKIKEDSAEIGIKICETEYQNKGYGSKLLLMLIEFLFTDGSLNNEEREIKRIILDTNLKNIRAQKTYEKLGFKKLRINLDSWKDQLNNLQSSVDYELSKEDYQKLYLSK